MCPPPKIHPVFRQSVCLIGSNKELFHLFPSILSSPSGSISPHAPVSPLGLASPPLPVSPPGPVHRSQPVTTGYYSTIPIPKSSNSVTYHQTDLRRLYRLHFGLLSTLIKSVVLRSRRYTTGQCAPENLFIRCFVSLLGFAFHKMHKSTHFCPARVVHQVPPTAWSGRSACTGQPFCAVPTGQNAPKNQYNQVYLSLLA